jgi:hypothetical protein
MRRGGKGGLEHVEGSPENQVRKRIRTSTAVLRILLKGSKKKKLNDG